MTLGLLLLATPVFAEGSLERVIVVDPTLATLVSEGHTRSMTFRDLIDRIERSDWVVFVQAGRCPDRAAIGCLLHVVGTFDGRRYVRLLVNPHGRHPDQVITILAHELQHALEVAAAGTVMDVDTLMQLQRQIASSRSKVAKAELYETAAARKVEEVVFRELRQR
jgi:hypothetical protein